MEDNKIYYNSDKYKLCGILNETGKNSTIVVICHANFSSKNSNPVKKLQKKLKDEKINSFCFDFRCCGESTGFDTEYTIKGLVRDLENTLHYLEKIGYDKFILVGMSMGGRIVSLINTSKYKIQKNRIRSEQKIHAVHDSCDAVRFRNFLKRICRQSGGFTTA